MYADPLADEIRGRVDALVGQTVDHRGQALVEDGGRDRAAPRLTAVTVAAPEAVPIG